MTSKMKVFVASAAVAASALVLGSVRPVEAQGIQMQDATRIALAEVPGEVHSVERDIERGRAVFEVEVFGDDGLEHELVIDAEDGRVLREAIDD